MLWALGNFVDRAMHGEVVDKLELTFILSVIRYADMFITTGVIIVVIDTLRASRAEKALIQRLRSGVGRGGYSRFHPLFFLFLKTGQRLWEHHIR
ncbi:signal peptidase II [Paenibacillus sp. FSL K6-3166]|uniref:signal peptidase II n=1 Tax=Paenibacillus sp. FSL K6-3166 TaxID=2921492 RepID=UPI0030F5DC48